ncbi:potassium transporter TrkG [Streptomyces sp. NPDC057424]|uniref:potassium transporter TrkG n=1 Tax=Streptomyces sp. NPDC057424 TaxID=3346127 RepID=UPI0036B8ED93
MAGRAARVARMWQSLFTAHPARTVVMGFGSVILLGTAVLMLPVATGGGASVRESIWDATYLGFFHAVSAFNNAGLGLHADSLTRYALDPLVTLPVAVAVILGGIGSPCCWSCCGTTMQPTPRPAALGR